MEQLSVEDAVKVWAYFDLAHEGHPGAWRRYDEDAQVLRMGCRQCITDKVIHVYVEDPVDDGGVVLYEGA